MNNSVMEALSVLGFNDMATLPKLKEIRKRFLQLSLKYHPDKNGDTSESKEYFQRILDPYNVAGEACKNTVYEDDDDEDKLARKMFTQFCFSSVQENANSFTIKTEKSLYSIWKDVLIASLGQPQDLKAHGLKFTVDDTCSHPPARIFLTFYTTGKLLIQAKGNQHCFNEHFVQDHLEPLFSQVYNRKKLQKTLSHKTPITKHTSGKAVSRVHKCLKCDFKCTEISIFYQHKKREHGRSGRNILEKPHEKETSTPAYSVLPLDGSSNRSVVVVPHADDCTVPLPRTPKKNVPCILCEESFPDPPSATKHIQTHHEISCDECDEVFFSKDDLKSHTHKHVASVASEPSNQSSQTNNQSCKFFCMLCGSGYHTDLGLDKHICSQHEIKCEICHATFYDKYDLTVHTNGVHGTTTLNCLDNKMYTCDICQTECRGNKELKIHIEINHSFEALFSTKEMIECEKRVLNTILEEFIEFLPTAWSFDSHASNFSEWLPESTECFLNREPNASCNAEFNGSIFDYSDKSINSKDIEYEPCDHKTTHTTSQSDHPNSHDAQFHTTNEVGESLNFLCSFCGLTFCNTQQLTNHVHMHHTFYSDLSVNDHGLQEYHELCKCSECEVSFNMEADLMLHFQSNHSNPPVPITFPCPDCGITFAEIKDLEGHVNRCHKSSHNHLQADSISDLGLQLKLDH